MQTIRHWFVYGLYSLYQYWLSCYYSFLVFIIYLSQSIKTYHETQRLAIHIWIRMMAYRFRLYDHAKMKPSPDDSG
jgi:hypothetical protein